MTITKLIVGGFKSIRERTEIPIAPLTLLFGPNSAGKSAVLAALDELSKKLITQATDESSLLKTMRLFIQDHNPNAHQLPSGPDDEEPSHASVILGLELDEFPAGETSFDGRLDDARLIALDLYKTLDGASVRLEFVEAVAGLQFGALVAVDGRDLVEFGDATTLVRAYPSTAESPDLGPIASLLGGEQFADRKWDGMVLQTEHPFWRESALATKMKELRLLAERGTSSFVRQAISLDGDSLVIRTPASLFHADGWGGRDGAERSLRDVCLHGVAGESTELTSAREELLQAMILVDLVCASVSFLVSQMRFIAHRELKFARVAGDRKVLTEDDLTIEFELPQAGHRGGSGLNDYAAWLGVLSAGDNVASASVMAAVRERDDFINDALRLDFFPGRSYQVKPEVWQITTTHLLQRNPTWTSDDGDRLKVCLFLEDDNGRRLNFSEVGSGVSYVMPVLVALWGADRSWIEQPELHLHPAAQCELGDVVIRAFNRGRFSIIETHSEHLLLRVLRRIRQTANGPTADPELRCHAEAVSILYFEPLPDGSTKVRPIRVSRSGDFMDRWPHGFFAERDRELLDE